jgi:hypothetical protein
LNKDQLEKLEALMPFLPVLSWDQVKNFLSGWSSDQLGKLQELLPFLQAATTAPYDYPNGWLPSQGPSQGPIQLSPNGAPSTLVPYMGPAVLRTIEAGHLGMGAPQPATPTNPTVMPTDIVNGKINIPLGE